MMKLIFVVSLAMAVMCHLGTLVPPPGKLTPETAKCLLGSGHDFTAIRVYTSEGKVDPNAVANLQAAMTAGFKNIDVFVSPCLPCEPETQIKEVVDMLKGKKPGTLWINIDVPGWREFKAFNQLFLEDLLNGFSKAGLKVGILGSKFQWEEFFGPGYSGGSKYDLMYESLNKKADFNDFKPFGGWRKPAAKHFQSGALLCSLKMELLFKPQQCSNHLLGSIAFPCWYATLFLEPCKSCIDKHIYSHVSFINISFQNGI
eukprot:TRINITY_DN120406_c0_g1_i1.p9 TRINITY_DN120406_c0_g1~~TRINITY_DN120406_c0_g1_i1.p9  ORF type:complete len:258 (+),score=29.66 TRINITY_DN120406_c0_g1_i1:6970-7743(+)